MGQVTGRVAARVAGRVAGVTRGGARSGRTVQVEPPVGAVAVGRSVVPDQRRAGFFQQPVEHGARRQRKCLGVAALHPVLQLARLHDRGADQRAQGLLERLQRGHATGVDLLPAGQRRPA